MRRRCQRLPIWHRSFLQHDMGNCSSCGFQFHDIQRSQTELSHPLKRIIGNHPKLEKGALRFIGSAICGVYGPLETSISKSSSAADTHSLQSHSLSVNLMLDLYFIFFFCYCAQLYFIYELCIKG
jgi:hypothetical protein